MQYWYNLYNLLISKFIHIFVHYWYLLIDLDIYPWDMRYSKFMIFLYYCRIIILDIYYYLILYDIILKYI